MRFCGLVGLGLALVLAGAGAWHVSAYLHEQSTTTRAQALCVTESFADVVAPWLSLGRRRSLDIFADLLLKTGCIGIRFSTEGEVAYERGETADWRSLEKSQWSETARLQRSGILGAALAEAIVPVSIAPGESPFGYVQAVFSADRFSDAVRARAALVGSTWALSCGGMLVGLWILDRRLGADDRRDRRSEGQFYVDREARRVLIRGESMELPPKLFAFLACLAQEPGRVYSDQELLEVVWSASDYADSKDVKQCVYLLRSRLKGVVGKPECLIRNIKGHGYCLDLSAI